jgi:hypothetical protein
LGHGVKNLLVAPAAQSGFLVGGDVGAVNGAGGDRKLTAACVERSLRNRVARTTARQSENVLAFGEQFFVISRSFAASQRL